jgi:hypothetical protein
LSQVDGERIWHLAAYSDFFPDVESAEAATMEPVRLSRRIDHVALTNRAFESTQVARVATSPLTDDEITPLREWQADNDRHVSDRSIRLLMGLR